MRFTTNDSIQLLYVICFYFIQRGIERRGFEFIKYNTHKSYEMFNTTPRMGSVETQIIKIHDKISKKTITIMIKD